MKRSIDEDRVKSLREQERVSYWSRGVSVDNTPPP